MSKLELYYFSGTGNSLHVAKELQKRIPETNLIPMVSLINKDVVETNAETIGFVFPIHFTTVPMIVKSIISKLDLKSAKYIFTIVTRQGTPCRTAFTKIENILKKKGLSLDSFLILNMASNDPKFENWRPATRGKIAELEAEVQNRLNSFQRIITDRVKYQEKDSQISLPVNPLLEHLGSIMADIRGYSGEKFYTDSKCSSCGICERVCLSQRIKMVDGEPVWQKNTKCFLCYACINFCPSQSIQIKSSRLFKICTDKNKRYFHPEATVEDIFEQK